MKKRNPKRGQFKPGARYGWRHKPVPGQLPASERHAALLAHFAGTGHIQWYDQIDRDIQALIDAGLLKVGRTQARWRHAAHIAPTRRNTLTLTFTPEQLTVPRIPSPYAKRKQWISEMKAAQSLNVPISCKPQT